MTHDDRIDRLERKLARACARIEDLEELLSHYDSVERMAWSSYFCTHPEQKKDIARIHTILHPNKAPPPTPASSPAVLAWAQRDAYRRRQAQLRAQKPPQGGE